MKESIIFMAEYNKTVNLNLIEFLNKCDDKILFTNTENKYGSILEIINHIIYCDIYILNQVNNLHNLKLNTKFIDPIYNNFNQSNNNYKCTTLLEAKELFISLGELYIDITKEIDESIYNTVYKELGYELWKVFYHIFNHSTHHRGAIQHILNTFNIYEDFSGVNQNMKYLK